MDQEFCGSAARREESRIRFVESPRSPFRRSRRSLSHFDQSFVAEKRSIYILFYIYNVHSAGVGSLTKVNTHVRYEGLLASTSMEPLISERDIHSKMFQISNTTKKENEMVYIYCKYINTVNGHSLGIMLVIPKINIQQSYTYSTYCQPISVNRTVWLKECILHNMCSSF